MSLIEVKNLSFKYDDKAVLKNVSLAVEKGSFTVLCGHSGSGKTTLLKFFKPSIRPAGYMAGEISFGNGIDKDRRADAEKIAFIGQDPDNDMTGERVWQHIAFGMESLGYDNGFIKKRAAETAAFFGISDIFEAKTENLSGGQKQLVNLASAIMTDPEMIILDEPTATLDPVGADRLFDMLEKINRDLGITVVISEHRLERCIALSDRLVIMDGGRIVFDDKKEELFTFLNENKYYTGLFNHMVRLGAKTGGWLPFTVREGRQFAKSLGVRGEITDENIKNAEAVIDFDELWFRYNETDVLKGASGKVYKGEVFALLGSNGAGKSTLLSVLAGAKKPYRGKVKIARGLVTGFMPQNPKALFYKNSMIEDMLTVTRDEQFIRETANFCGIDALLGRHPFDVSGGELQRAALCKILLKKPDVIFMDEPTKGMDGEFKNRFARLIDGLKREGKTVFMVSHDTEFCAESADRCGLFFGGKVMTEAGKREFFASNRFYTTAVNRSFKGVVEGAVTDKDILKFMGAGEGDHPRRDEDKDEPLGEYTELRKEKSAAGTIVMLAVITAIAVAARLAFFMLPQFKPVAAVVITAGCVFGPCFGLATGALSMLASNMFFGHGPWTVFQMAGMGLVGLMAGMLFKGRRMKTAVAVYGFVAVLVIYGVIVNISNVFMYQDSISLGMIIAACAAALPMDILHGVFTAGLIFVFGREFMDKLEDKKEISYK
ncbi:MAG: ATP-binding cassette domain-containing protein [Lachnospiraceae bacterium]|nr:ATP-binding cassette domain-containing protein [Lachnospiraceae bacterium]